MQRPTEEEVKDWQSHPVTKWKIGELKANIALIADRIISGQTLSSDPGVTAQITAREVGEAAGLDAAIDILEEDMNDDDS